MAFRESSFSLEKYSSQTEENMKCPRFLFDTVARLANSQSSVKPNILLMLNSNDFMNLFTIREKVTANFNTTDIYLD